MGKIVYTIAVIGKARKGKNNFMPNGGNDMFENLFLIWYILRDDDKKSDDDGGGGCGCLIVILIIFLFLEFGRR